MNVMRHKVGAVLFILLILLSGISPTVHAMMAPVTYSVRGKVIDRQSRQPVAYANVFVARHPRERGFHRFTRHIQDRAGASGHL